MTGFKQYLLNEKLEFTEPWRAIDYAIKAGHRISEVEDFIKDYPYDIYLYIVHVIKGRFPEIEDVFFASARQYQGDILYWKEYIKYISNDRLKIYNKPIKKMIEENPEQIVSVPLTPEEVQLYIQLHGKRAYLLNKMLIGRV